MANFDREYTQARKMALALATKMPALIKDMTAGDPTWGHITELDDLIKKMADTQARFNHAALYNENEVEAFYTVMSDTQHEIDKADADTLDCVRSLCCDRDTVSTVQLRKAAYALGANADDFAAARPRGFKKDSRGVTQIKSDALVSWIHQKMEE